MDVRQGTPDVAAESSTVINAQGASAREHLLERSPTEVLTDHEDRTGLLTAVKDAREVRVAQGGGLDDPLTEDATDVLVTGQSRQQHLHDDRALKRLVVGQVDLGRVADAQELLDPVAVDQKVSVGEGGWRHSP